MFVTYGHQYTSFIQKKYLFLKEAVRLSLFAPCCFHIFAETVVYLVETSGIRYLLSQLRFSVNISRYGFPMAKGTIGATLRSTVF